MNKTAVAGFLACLTAFTGAVTTACGGDDFDANPTPGAGGQSGSGGSSGSSACSPECGATQECCNEQCVDTTIDANHCGSCGNACTRQRATTSCVAGQCTIEACAEGFVDCNGNPIDGCEASDDGLPGAPRLISPLQGEYTGSVRAEAPLMPRLTWLAPASTGTCGSVTYHVQLDDSCERDDFAECEFPSPEFEENGVGATSFAPSTPLPARREPPVGTTYFWRIRACETATRCSSWSEVRYLNVGRLRDDLNGDGRSDVIALSMDGESPIRVHIVIGGAPIETDARYNLQSSYDAFGDVRFVGDVNGDGFMDAVRAQPASASGVTTALLLGAADLEDIQSLELPQSGVFQAVAAAGDMDADGFDDFAVSDYSPGAAGENDGVRIYRGAAVFSAEQPIDIARPAGTTSIEFGNELEGALDLNADGFSDLAVMDGDDARIHVVRGGRSGTPAIGASLVTGVPCPYYAGAKLARAGDMTGDGISELAARCSNQVLVYAGSRTLELDPVWSHELEPTGLSYGPDVVGGRDLGQDGLADLVFGGRSAGTNVLMLLAGSTTLSATSEPVPFGGSITVDDAEASVGEGLTLGDHDGDGRWDVVVQVATAPFGLRWLSGGSVMAAADSCVQPSSSFEALGNWCEAAGANVAASYTMATGMPYPLGSSFGYVLAR
jgi:hypothetical protein